MPTYFPQKPALKKILLAIILGVFVVVAIFPSSALAVGAAPKTESGGTSVYAFQMGTALYWVLTGLLQGIQALAQIFETFIHYGINVNIPVITNTWKIVRDFANMFFILIIIIMAFATIFDVSGYQVNAQLITKFLIVAILINFSLTLSGLFIGGVDRVNGVFINGLGNIGSRFAQVFNASEILGSDKVSFGRSITAMLGTAGCNATGLSWLGFDCVRAGASIAGVPQSALTWATSFRLFFSVILVGMIAFGMLISTLFALIRIPFLWFLLIFSPLAGLASILPATRQGWNMWFKEFIAWNTFLPIYLFFLYFGMYFLSSQNQVMASLSAYPVTEKLQGIGFSIQFVFFYLVAGFILLGGSAFAFAASRSAGGLASTIGAKWSQGAANWTRSFAGRATLVTPAYQGAKEGLKAKGERIRKEGMFGIGGSLKGEATRAGVAQIFGVRGAVEEQRRAKIKYFEDKFKKDNLDTPKLRANLNSARGEEKLAIYRRLKDLKDLGGDEMLEAYKSYKSIAGGNSATDFAKEIDFKKDLEKNERLDWFKEVTVGEDVKRKLANIMADEGELKRGEIFDALRLYKPGSNERRDFLLSKVAKKKLVEAYRIAERLGIPDARGTRVDTNQYLEKEIARRKGEDLLGLIDGGFYDPNTDRLKDPATLNPEQKILMNKLIDVFINKSDIVRNLLKNPNASPEQQMVITFLGDAARDRGTRRAGGTPPPKRAPHADPFP